MRAALIRSRTRKGVSVNIELYQSPVILYVQPDEVNVTSINRTVPLSFAVTVNGDSSRHIGGITVRRQVLLRRKVPKTKQKWTDWEEIQAQEVHLVADCQIHGKQRFECSMPLPAKLPETRQTHYDQLIHLLTATVHDKAPEYVNHRKHSRHRAASTASATSDYRSGLEEDYPRICTKELEAVTTKEADVVAESKKVFEVVHSGTSSGELPTLDAEQSLLLSDSGKAKVKLHSDLFVLGSTLNVGIDFLDLTHDTTIHAMSIKMVQETATPIKTAIPEDISSPVPAIRSGPPAQDQNASRSPSLRRRSDRPLLTRLSSLFAGVKEKPSSPQTSIIDEYVLHSEGVDHYVTSQGFGVRPGMYLWRGEAGRNLDQAQDTDEYLDEYKLDHQATQDNAILRTVSSLRLNRSVRLPSELQDAHPTSSTLAPVLARISHRIAINIIYSVLGRDAQGKSIDANGKSMQERMVEGVMRQVTLVFEVGLMPCVALPSTIRPPAYADENDDDLPDLIAPASSPRRMFRRFSMETVRPPSLHRHDSHGPAQSANKATAERIIAASIHHSRAFRASNGLVVTGNRVFYSDQEVEEAVTRHQREKGSCACLM